jgi:hypothetical protein
MRLTNSRLCSIPEACHFHKVNTPVACSLVEELSIMSNDDYDEVDETEDSAEDDIEEETETEVEADAEAAGAAATPAQRSDVADAETLTVSSKEALRRQLEEEMKRFLAKGGKVQEIDPDVTTDPPQKPSSNYGSKPI